jgi:phage shock protein A
VILHKFWSAFVAQINKVANLFWEADPIAQMRYEYDGAVEQLKEGRGGLEQYRGLVERVTRQVAANRSHVQKLEAETKAYLKAGDRAAEAEIAKLSETFNVNLTTDFGEIESVIQQRIDQNRGKVRVAADLSEQGIAEIKAEERLQGQLAEQALQDFEVELGMRSPETTPVSQTAKDLGPATEKQTS